VISELTGVESAYEIPDVLWDRRARLTGLLMGIWYVLFCDHTKVLVDELEVVAS
jgi:hypothetical protein